MAYSTASDITARYDNEIIKDVSDNKSTGTINTTLLDVLIADADSLIDTYLLQAFDVPLTTVPTIIKLCSVDIALYKLYRNRYDDKIPKDIISRYEEAIKFLERAVEFALKKGVSLLSGVSIKSNFTPKVLTSTVEQVFSPTVMEQY